MSFDPVERLRAGDASAWPRHRPEHLPVEEVHAAWISGLQRRGSPGAPAAIRAYTHFAYCESTCDFCMYFHQVPREVSAYARYVDHLVSGLERFERVAGRVTISSGYFGGGTPGATPTSELDRFFRAFSAAFAVEGELSFEAHPRSMTLEKLELVHSHGVNRISMGVQSLEPAVLREITRKNAPLEDLAELVARARALGVVVNLDLVLGLPNQTLDSFRSDMARITELGPDIVTLYRYQQVPKLAHKAPAGMHYEHAFDEQALAAIERLGYRIGDPVDDGSVTVRLLRADYRQRWYGGHTYALFDDQPSQLIGFGPGAYGHAFGYGWFREVTSMDQLGAPTYWGTRLSAADECRQLLLSALDAGRSWDRNELFAQTDVDVEHEPALGNALAWARAAGLLERDGDRQRFVVATPELRSALVDRLMPAGEPRGGSAPPVFQRELVELRRPQPRDGSGDAALMRAFCQTIGVPERGRRLLGAIVRDMDDRSLYFSVRGADVLRVFVSHPGSGPSFFETPSFAISYAARPNAALTDAERTFLQQLKEAMQRAESLSSPAQKSSG